jgi:hypothetical protein
VRQIAAFVALPGEGKTTPKCSCRRNEGLIMADHLKQAITKLIANKGEKELFFVYAAGVRKDGKGDGERIARGARPKKANVEGGLKAGPGFENALLKAIPARSADRAGAWLNERKSAFAGFVDAWLQAISAISGNA